MESSLNFFESRVCLLGDNAMFSFQMEVVEEFWSLLYNELFGDDTLDQEMLEFHCLVWELVGLLW